MARLSLRALTAVLIGAFSTLALADAEAQTIRNYSDSGTTNVQVVAPGQPVPQQQAAPAAEEGEARGEEGASAPVGSYRISLHGQAGTRQQQEERQRILGLEADELYRGVIPGTRDEVAHMRRAREDGARTERPNPLTWIGFQPEADRTRVFFQSPRPMQYSIQRETDGLVVVFENARIPDRNFSRFIDASYFGRTVSRIEAAQGSGQTVRVKLQLRESVEPTVRVEGEYLFLEFPHQERAASADDSAAR